MELNKGIYHNNNYLEFNDDWTWSPVELEFSNMFCWRQKRNQFHKNKRCSGYFSSKSLGKSSILDIILFALYDKISRGNAKTF